MGGEEEVSSRDTSSEAHICWCILERIDTLRSYPTIEYKSDAKTDKYHEREKSKKAI